MKDSKATKKFFEYRFFPAVCLGLLFLAGLTVYALLNYDLLRKFGELTYFSPRGWFFAEQMDRAGGLVNYVSLFLTQFFYYPWLGALMLTGCFIGLAVLTARAFHLPDSCFGLATVPSLMGMLLSLALGYEIYTVKCPGYPFNIVTGLSAALALMLLYRKVGKLYLRLAVIIVSTVVCYPFLGFYALYGAGLCVLWEISHKHSPVLIVVAIGLIAAVPTLYFYLLEWHQMLDNCYTAGLPLVAIWTVPMYIEIGIMFIVPALLALLSRKDKTAEKSEKARLRMAVGSTVVMVLAVASLFIFRYNDRNFSTTISMDVAMEDGDFDRMLRLARDNGTEPSRLICMFTHVALNNKQTAGDSLFTFQASDAEYDSPRPDHALRQIAARGINYQFGRINDSYRWCMEDFVEYGPKVEYLQYMTKCALLNGEFDLARRYLNKLDQTLFYKGWAAKYRNYADNPELMLSDPELMRLRQLMAYGNNIAGDGALIESYLNHFVSCLEPGTPELNELSLQFNLIRKDIPYFWLRLREYQKDHAVLPVHYQEAALLFATLEGSEIWKLLKISPVVQRRFQAFMKMAKQYSNYSDEENLKIFRPEFGDTYWYYYFFVKGLRTT